MKAVILTVRKRFTKAEVVENLYFSFNEVTTWRELKKLVKRKHVFSYGQAMLDIQKEYGFEIDEDTMADEQQSIIEGIAEELGLQRRIDEMESFQTP